MNSLFRNLLAVAAGALIIPSAEAAVIASWSFPSYAVDSGTAAAFSTATLATSANGGAWNASGTSLQFTGTGSQANGSYFTFVLTAAPGHAVTLDSLTFNYGMVGNKGPTTVTWTWTGSSSGSGSSSPSMVTTTGWSQTAPSLSFGGITLNGGQSISLVGVLSGGKSSDSDSGNIAFDNFKLNGVDSYSPVPEPAHYALAVFSLIFVGTGAVRWWLVRMKRA